MKSAKGLFANAVPTVLAALGETIFSAAQIFQNEQSKLFYKSQDIYSFS
jgi:hypothetical protein